MELDSTVAALAGGATAAAYFNAKYHWFKDAKAIWTLSRSRPGALRAVKRGEVNGWLIFLQTVKKYGDSVAIWTRECSYTYREVQDQACQYAHYLLSQGVQKGDLVALYLQNRAEFIIAWLGLWSIGCAPAGINYNLAGDALIHCLKTSDAKLILADEDVTCRANIEGSQATLAELGMTAVTIDDSFRAHIRTFPTTRPPKELALNISGDFPGILLYTSGTTGLPKATAFTMARLYAGYTERVAPVGDKPGPNGDRWYNCMPLYHGTAAIIIMTAFVQGTSVSLAPKFSVSNFWKDVRDSESTLFVYVGETARYLLAAPPSSQDRNHKVRGMWGNGLRPDIWDRFRDRFGIAEIYEFFNSSEGVFGLLNVNMGPFTTGAVGHHGLIMRTILRNTYAAAAIDPDSGDIIRDPKTGFAIRRTLEEGGEILVNIPNEDAFQGYRNNEEATKKKFLRDVFKKGDLYFRTGDALRRQSDGRWYFMDRLGDTYRWKSENVSTAEVSEALGKFPGIIEANVYGVLVPKHEGRAGCAALQIDPDVVQKFDFAEFARFARSKLPRYAVPLFLRVVDNPTHIHNNKQNKAPLRSEGVDPSLIGTKVPDGQTNRFYWLPPKENTYQPFGEKEWELLTNGGARL